VLLYVEAVIDAPPAPTVTVYAIPNENCDAVAVLYPTAPPPPPCQYAQPAPPPAITKYSTPAPARKVTVSLVVEVAVTVYTLNPATAVERDEVTPDENEA
jgi:hypothetical protein